ncbi:cupin domain-containing protein [Spectribacter hydrogenooxidans]|uniref:ChrR-like cupin domain-containing protein n=1 Tax=Spectribacter hydrogenoxidans TaxID=3075608 RepID=A0ABU3BVU8_9GAMM|nr:hypothetical protein [Salinisphaera sp. W335]MDT0633413.1 hypothetical protein [Salinisphaera sp. W335]
MATPAAQSNQTLPFDDRNINWLQLGEIEPLLEGVEAWFYDVDEKQGAVDALLRFPAHARIVLHRHLAPYRTLVLQGELRLYDRNDKLTEIRPVGSYVYSDGNGDPHSEGGGDQDVVVFFSNRNIRADGAVYELLDADLNPVKLLGLSDFKALQGMQNTGA